VLFNSRNVFHFLRDRLRHLPRVASSLAEPYAAGRELCLLRVVGLAISRPPGLLHHHGFPLCRAHRPVADSGGSQGMDDREPRGDLGLLGFFKYFNFFAEALRPCCRGSA